MINLNQKIHIIEGATRSDRAMHTLVDTRVRILDYEISSFYENITQLSKLIVFYNEDNEVDGTWHDLLANDYVFSLISIKEIDLNIFTNNILDNISLSVDALETSFKEDTVKIILKDIFDVFRKNLQPKVRVDYYRKPYIVSNGLYFRLTFDNQISSSKVSNLDFKKDNQHNILCKAGFTVLELKFERSIPAWFHRIIQSYDLQRRSISKYVLGMCYCKLGYETSE